MRRYEEAYPRIPKEEIRGSCVTHPSGKYEDGSPWLWLLDSKHVVQPVSHDTVCYTVSPAERALQMIKDRLPVKQASVDGNVRYAISVDQYNAVVLAVTPLQRLWMKANEHGLVGCFGDPLRVEQLLALVEKVSSCIQYYI